MLEELGAAVVVVDDGVDCVNESDERDDAAACGVVYSKASGQIGT